MLCRQSTFPRPDDSSASPSRWGSEARQKPPLPSPRRPPAPPSPYNRSTPAAQPSNPYQGRSTLRHTNHALQANSPRQSSLGYLINTPSEVDHMDSAKWKSQLEGQHVTSSSAQRLDATHTPPSQQGNLNYPAPGTTQQASSMPDSMGNGQAGMPGFDQRIRSNNKLGTARTSRSGRSRGPGSRAGSAMGSAASAWAQSHSAHQLAANVKALAVEVCCLCEVACCLDFAMSSVLDKSRATWPVLPSV